MAFQKSISLPNGVTADYFRITTFSWDRNAREASAYFALFLNSQVAQSGQALVPIIAKLRLYGARFDEYLGTAALETSSNDVIAQLYAAARAACVIYETQGATDPEAIVICDYGKGIFANALNI